MMKEGDGAGGGGDNPRANWLVRVGETGHRNIQGTGRRTIACVGPVVRLTDWWGALCFGGVGAPAAKDDHLPTGDSYPRHDLSCYQSIAAAFSSCTGSLALFSQADFCFTKAPPFWIKILFLTPTDPAEMLKLFGAAAVEGLGYWTITSNQY